MLTVMYTYMSTRSREVVSPGYTSQAFPMYGGLSMSLPSLHKESTDSL